MSVEPEEEQPYDDTYDEEHQKEDSYYDYDDEIDVPKSKVVESEYVKNDKPLTISISVSKSLSSN